MDAAGVRQFVLDALTELDPYSLAPGSPEGAPPDEYALEAAPIAQVLCQRGLVDVATVDRIWLTWFAEPLSGVIGEADLDAFVNHLNAASTTNVARPAGIAEGLPRNAPHPGAT